MAEGTEEAVTVRSSTDHSDRFFVAGPLPPNEKYSDKLIPQIEIFKADSRVPLLNGAMTKYTIGIAGQITGGATITSLVSEIGFTVPKRDSDRTPTDPTSRTGEKFILDVKRYMLVFDRADFREQDSTLVTNILDGPGDISDKIFNVLDNITPRQEDLSRQRIGEDLGRLLS